jgi:hypothetical protein
MVIKRQQEAFEPVTMGHIRSPGCRDLLVYCVLWDGATRGRSKHMRLFFLDLLVGIVIGAVGATIYAELSDSGPGGGAAGGAGWRELSER